MAHIGRRNQLGIGLETTPGTAANPTHFIPFLECSLQERHTPIPDSQARGRRDLEGYDSVEGKKWGDGKIEVILDSTTAPYWLALALGEITSEEEGEETFKHTIAASQNGDPLTATIYLNRIINQARFTNVVVDSLELNFADDVAKISVDVLSKFPTIQTPPTTLPEEQSLNYYTFQNATVQFGTTEVKVRELTLKIENEAEPIYALGSNDVDRIVWKGLRVSGSFKLLWEDATQLTAFRNLTKQSITISFEGADDSSIAISIPSVRVDEWEAEADIDDLVHENIDFVAEYDAASDSTISIEVINKVEQYLPSS